MMNLALVFGTTNVTEPTSGPAKTRENGMSLAELPAFIANTLVCEFTYCKVSTNKYAKNKSANKSVSLNVPFSKLLA